MLGQEMTMVNVKLLFEQMLDRVAAEIARANAMIAARYRSIRSEITSEQLNDAATL